jgi:hypothetical protein
MFKINQEIVTNIIMVGFFVFTFGFFGAIIYRTIDAMVNSPYKITQRIESKIRTIPADYSRCYAYTKETNGTEAAQSLIVEYERKNDVVTQGEGVITILQHATEKERKILMNSYKDACENIGVIR